MNLDTSYLYKSVSPVLDKLDFFKNGTPEAPILRRLDQGIKRLLVVSDKYVLLSIIGENEGYRFDILGAGGLKEDFTAQIYYFPKTKGLDIYDHGTIGTGLPLVAFRNKKCVLKNYSILLQTLKFENMFNSLITLL